MKQNRIIVIDNVIIGDNHIVNNAGLINILGELYGESIIEFYSEAQHASSVRELLSSKVLQRIHFYPITVVNPAGGIVRKIGKWVGKVQKDVQILINILDQAKTNDAMLVYFCTLIPLNIFRFLPILRKYNSLKFVIGLHGEIEYMFDKRASIKGRILSYLYQKSFQNVPENVVFSVLSPTIKKCLVEAGFLKGSQLIWMEHPIQTYIPCEEKKFHSPPTLAFLGVLSTRKNGHYFLETANKFDEYSKRNKIKFELIGRINSEFHIANLKSIQFVSKDNKPIPLNSYRTHCQNVTYALSFLQGDQYQFRISGSLMDAIQYHLPLIALQHEYVNHLFTIGGDIGFLCKDIVEMHEIIQRLIDGDLAWVSRYDNQVANMKNLSVYFQDESNMYNLKNAIQEIGWEAVLSK